MAALVVTERQGRVLVATLARPPVNALDDPLIAALDAVLEQAIDDDEVAVLHLRSEQRAFSAGADLSLIESCFATPHGPDRMTDVVRDMQRLYARLEAAPLVTLAEIGAPALGGGFELALACDLRVAANEARLGLPEARLGLLPGAGGTQRLTRLCGPGLARRLILGAEMIDGASAERLGLVQWAVPHAQLAYFAAQVAQRYAAMPRAALAANKRCIAAATDPARDGYADEIAETRRLYDHPDTRARVSDFLAAKAH
ncbi:MAG TPA: enoyl-CoA hydratase/isomerase family protein [Rubrivivax sp.]|nr:enoyl-CoA hydratase/isomerase family protein [Rubrivivax sp.]HPO19618.1 enoyl-CoA hydratase/isomerase family protein [Rubrivivax sp.]